MPSPRSFLQPGVVLLCCVGCGLSGCSVRKQPSIEWGTAIKARPVIQERNTAASSDQEDSLPEVRFELPPFPGPLMTVRSAPPRPRNGTPPPSAPGHDSEKLGAPVIAPQLTAQESAVAQQQTNQSLGIAEKNLASVRGKRLNSAQSDLISKITGFIKDAREAAQIADWGRARGMAKKAQVLSEELAGSL